MGQLCSNFSERSPTLTADALENLEIIHKKESFKNARTNSKIFSNKTVTISEGSILPINSPSNQSTPSPLVAHLDFSPSSLIPQKTWDGERLCQENANMRTAFINYIRSQVWIHKINVDIKEQVVARRRPTMDTQEITFNEYSVHSRASSSDSREMEGVAQTMMRCTQLKIRDSMQVGQNRRIETCFTADQMKPVLLATLWPLFLESPAYEHANNKPQEPFKFHEVSADDDQEGAPSARDQEKIRHLRDIYIQTCNRTSDHELDMILHRGQWVKNLLDSLETSPLSVSISKAHLTEQAFPIIYVNRSFEIISGYPRDEVLGHGDDILVCDASERDQLAKVSEAVQRAEGIKIAITHKRRDDKTFLDFLALRPVLSREKKDYRFLIAVQYDISKAQASLREIKMVGDFLSLMANVLKG
eukprot:scaffold14461_cov250-Ochromonas_danica.AAC.8